MAENNQTKGLNVIEKGANDNPFTQADSESEAYLTDPNLFENITDLELDKKIKGEKETRKAIFLWAMMALVRNRGKGAASNLLINAESSAGKDYVSDRILELFPNNMVEYIKRVSPASFTYYKANDNTFTWDGKICKLTDISDNLAKSDVFKTFISDGGKSIITNKTKSGTLEAIEYVVNGKPVVIATTAKSNPNEEILNRFNIIPLDESEDQTVAINERQLLEAAGEISEDQEYSQVAKNALFRLKPVSVKIPFAPSLLGYLPKNLRARRDVPRMLNLIRASAALHQFQREKDQDDCIIAEEKDYEIARRAMQVIQTGSNVSLTRAQKRVFEVFELLEKNRPRPPQEKLTDEPPYGFKIKEIYSARPICSERNLYEHLQKLAELYLVEVAYTEPEKGRPAILYSRARTGIGDLKLPPFSEISENTSKSTKNTKSPDRGGLFEVLELLAPEKHIENPKPEKEQVLTINQINIAPEPLEETTKTSNNTTTTNTSITTNTSKSTTNTKSPLEGKEARPSLTMTDFKEKLKAMADTENRVLFKSADFVGEDSHFLEYLHQHGDIVFRHVGFGTYIFLNF